MDKAYSPTWFLYNQLSQITPMPAAWDRTASGPSHCDTTVSDCAAVYDYLNTQAKDVTGYVGSPLWSIVDGPWKLSAFNADGHVTFVPNKSYSGPGQAEAGGVPGGAVHHRHGRVRRAAVAEFQHQDRRRLPAAAERAGQAGQRRGGQQPGVRVHADSLADLGHQLLRAELPVHHR